MGQSETPYTGCARFSQCHTACLQRGACRAYIVHKQYLPSLNGLVPSGDFSFCRGLAGEGVAHVDPSFGGIQSYLDPGTVHSLECTARERQANHLAKGMGQQVRLIISSFALPGNMQWHRDDQVGWQRIGVPVISHQPGQGCCQRGPISVLELVNGLAGSVLQDHDRADAIDGRRCLSTRRTHDSTIRWPAAYLADWGQHAWKGYQAGITQESAGLVANDTVRREDQIQQILARLVKQGSD